MKVTSISVTIDTEGELHATVFKWKDGSWVFNGPCYGRVMVALHEAWKALRAIPKGE